MNILLPFAKNIFTGLVILLTAIWGMITALDLPLPGFYYFNPDSSQSNLDGLKREMEIFLSRCGISIAFQPFAHLTDFERRIREARPAMLMLPGWYFQKYGPELNLKPLLIPSRQGASHYKKVLLIARDSTIRPEDIMAGKKYTMAMTSLGPDSEAMIDDILFHAHGLDNHEITPIMVPKDSDALFALVLGQVDMAFVVSENLARIAQINPRVVQSVRPMLESAPIPMPVLCYAPESMSEAEVNRVKEMFMGAQQQQIRIKLMEMLQFDEWREYSK